MKSVFVLCFVLLFVGTAFSFHPNLARNSRTRNNDNNNHQHDDDCFEPSYDHFDWEKAGSYIGTGKANNIINFPLNISSYGINATQPTQNATIAINVEEQFIYYDLGGEAGGYYITRNESFVILGGTCWRVPSRNYSKHVENYKQAYQAACVREDETLKPLNLYQGWVFDVSSCQAIISVAILQRKNGLVKSFPYTSPIRLPGIGLLITPGVIWMESFERGPFNSTARFPIPSNCLSSTLSFCDFFFPTGQSYTPPEEYRSS